MVTFTAICQVGCTGVYSTRISILEIFSFAKFFAHWTEISSPFPLVPYRVHPKLLDSDRSCHLHRIRVKLIRSSCIFLYPGGTSTSMITMILKLHHSPHPPMSIQVGLRFASKLFNWTFLYPYGRHHRTFYFRFQEIWHQVKRSHKDLLTLRTTANGTKSLPMSRKRSEELRHADNGIQGYGNARCSFLRHCLRGLWRRTGLPRWLMESISRWMCAWTRYYRRTLFPPSVIGRFHLSNPISGPRWGAE